MLRSFRFSSPVAWSGQGGSSRLPGPTARAEVRGEHGQEQLGSTARSSLVREPRHSASSPFSRRAPDPSSARLEQETRAIHLFGFPVGSSQLSRGRALGEACVCGPAWQRWRRCASPVGAGHGSRLVLRILEPTGPRPPVLRPEAIWWASVGFLIFVPFISFHRPPQTWLLRETMRWAESVGTHLIC